MVYDSMQNFSGPQSHGKLKTRPHDDITSEKKMASRELSLFASKELKIFIPSLMNRLHVQTSYRLPTPRLDLKCQEYIARALIAIKKGSENHE